jgi:hypothetical protein
MNYSAQYQQMNEEEKGKSHKIKKRGVSDYDSQTRFMARRGHREAYENLAEDEAEYQEPEPQPRQRKTISVSKYKPESINPKSVKIRTADNKKERYEKRKEQREGKTVRQAAGELGGYVKDSIVKGFRETHKGKPKVEKAEPARQEPVHDNDTIRTVSKALTTRSQELRNIEDQSYRKQSAVENKKRTAKENAKAQRRGELRGMNTFDRVVETAADYTQIPIDVKEQLEEARAKVLHTTVRPKQKVTNKVPQAQKKQVLTAAQKRALQNQVAKAAKNISPKSRGAPFSVEKKSMTVTRHTLAVSSPSPGSITGKRQGNPLGVKSQGSPVAYNQPANPNGSRKQGNPFEIKKRTWSL